MERSFGGRPVLVRFITFLACCPSGPLGVGSSYRGPSGPRLTARDDAPPLRRSAAAAGSQTSQGMRCAAVVGGGTLTVPAGTRTHSNGIPGLTRARRSGARAAIRCVGRATSDCPEPANKPCRSRSVACLLVARTHPPRNQELPKFSDQEYANWPLLRSPNMCHFYCRSSRAAACLVLSLADVFVPPSPPPHAFLDL